MPDYALFTQHFKIFSHFVVKRNLNLDLKSSKEDSQE